MQLPESASKILSRPGSLSVLVDDQGTPSVAVLCAIDRQADLDHLVAVQALFVQMHARLFPLPTAAVLRLEVRLGLSADLDDAHEGDWLTLESFLDVSEDDSCEIAKRLIRGRTFLVGIVDPQRPVEVLSLKRVSIHEGFQRQLWQIIKVAWQHNASIPRRMFNFATAKRDFIGN